MGKKQKTSNKKADLSLNILKTCNVNSVNASNESLVE